MLPLSALWRALAQLPDPVFLGVLGRSLVWAALTFLAVSIATPWLLQTAWHAGPWGAHAAPWWSSGLLGAMLGALFAFLLYVPFAAGIAALYSDRVAAAVERRFYPGLAPPRGAAISVQAWDAAQLGLRVLGAQLAALALTLLLPGLGWAIGWAISAWALGRGLFMAVAMRRVGRGAALAQYHRQRGGVWMIGAGLAAAGLIPAANLLLPVIGIAAMVHLAHAGALAAASPGAGPGAKYP